MTEVQQSIVKTHLISQIDNLKKDIQLLIDYKKTLTNKDDILKCNETKQAKMSQLKNLTEKLKNIHKEERLLTQKQNELRLVSRAIDNIAFGAAKKRNNQLAMDKARLEKIKRDETRNQYLKYQMIEKKYLEYDSKILPGFLFLHSDVLQSYGLCPFIYTSTLETNDTNKNETNETNETNENGTNGTNETYENGTNETYENGTNGTNETYGTNDTDKLYQNRLQWLESQSDNGDIYIKLYNNLIKKEELNFLLQQSQELEKTIYDFTKSILTQFQLDLYDNSVTFIKEYTSCNIKTKRIKEKYKVLINNLSILYSETSLEFHTYLSLLFNNTFVVNIINSNSKKNDVNSHSQKNDGQDKFNKIIITERFTKYITKYKTNIENREKKQKFITNTIRNLNDSLYSFLSDKKTFLSKQNIAFSKSKIFQQGKYFKRWILLTETERLERFLAYSVYYVDKFLIENLVIKQEHRDLFTDKLYNVLKLALQSKTIIYRDFSWNTKRGIIENIKILKFTDKEFILNFTKRENKGAKADKERKKQLELNTSNGNETITNETITNETITNETKTLISKKKVSTRTIITKESEKIINEELLYYILKKSENNPDAPSKEDKDAFTERIKIKLKIKKLTVNDKLKIYEKYDEIFTVIKNNH
jgi:hypothetical protein